MERFLDPLQERGLSYYYLTRNVYMYEAAFKNIDDTLILKFAPKVVEGVNRLKKWSESI